MVQWLGICPPMQGTRVRALVWEDPTCHGATKPMRHNHWSPRVQSPCSATREATAMRSLHTAMKSSPRSPQLDTCIVKFMKTKNKQTKILKRAREKWCFIYRRKPVRMTEDFSSENREAIRKWHNILKCWKKRTVNPESYTQLKHPSGMKEKSRHS